ncbi:Protein RER1A [Capsicum annuum]|nr:Protein RER1A [Capsicum annuum]
MDINGAGTGDAAGDASSSATSSGFSQLTASASRSYQHFLDKTTPYLLYRWIAFFFIAVLYVVRVYLVEGFYVISYALGIYILNLLIGFLSPQVDPEFQELSDGPILPTRETDEFRPFVRRLPEFKFCLFTVDLACMIQADGRFILHSVRVCLLVAPSGSPLLVENASSDSWYSITKAFCIAFVLTFFDIFDVPVFWPILLFYWVVLFTLTMRRQIRHMLRYKYLPFSFGKQRYDGKKAASSESEDLLP